MLGQILIQDAGLAGQKDHCPIKIEPLNIQHVRSYQDLVSFIGVCVTLLTSKVIS